MKNICLFIAIIFIGCQKTPIYKVSRDAGVSLEYINIGTTANDGTGDRLREFARKTRDNFTKISTSLGDVPTETEMRNEIADSNNARMSVALPLEDYAWLKTDTIYGQSKQVVTQTQLASFEGGGGGVGMYELKGIVDTTAGIPETGDSLVINTGFISHPHILVYRNGALQYFNEGRTKNVPKRTNTYVFNQTTGTITVKPVFGTGEKLIVHAFDPIVWNSLTPQGGAGGGGGSGASSLLTGIVSSWMLNETTGTLFNDEVANNDGGATAAVGSIGKFALSRHYTLEDHYASVAYHSSLAMSGDEFAVSLWIRFDQLPSVTGRSAYLYSSQRTDGEYWSTLLYVNTSNQLRFYQKNNSNTPFLATTNTNAFVVDTWYNIIAIVDGAGNDLKLLINGVDARNATQTFTGTLLGFDSGIIIGGDGVTGAIYGYIDDVSVWLKSLTAPEIANLQTKYYPFN